MKIWIRDDDVGQDDDKFLLLQKIFKDEGIPVTYAVIPGLISEKHVTALADDYVIQHGWVHENHNDMPKSEFTTNRTFEQQLNDIQRGKQIMEQSFGENFRPVFAPPWHEMDDNTLQALTKVGFSTISVPNNHTYAGRMENIPIHTTLVLDDENLLRRCMQQILAGFQSQQEFGILVHHDELKTEQHVSLLRNFVRFLKNKSPEFITIPEVIHATA